MKLRVLTALPLALTVAWLIWQSSQWLFLLALVVTVEHGLYEFFNISRQAGFKVFPKVGYVAGGALCLAQIDRKSTRLNSSHLVISYAVFCLKKKKNRCHYVAYW